MDKNPTLQVRVPVWLAEAVTTLAVTQGVSQSEILRQALNKYLTDNDIVAPGLKIAK